jgi:Lanthionine synthetase C-like protein
VLFRPEAFEPLTERAWDGGRVRDAIRAIVADADAAYDPSALWPAEEWDAWSSPLPMTNLYVGAAGVVWALDALRRRGLAETALDLGEEARHVLAAWREQPDFFTGLELPEPRESSLLEGETGILLVAWRASPDAALADELLARVRANVENPADELMWGSPGTLLAARAMLDWTGEERWRDAWLESADALLARRGEDGVWRQRLHGETTRSLTPPHGLVGIVRVLLDGGELLPGVARDALRRDTAAVLARTAVVEDGLANWPTGEGEALAGGDGEIRVQWCAGAPGIVIAAADVLDEELLLAGGALAWRAGPPGLQKGPGICHGTAGNGYAFLKLFARTGDERWLERARRFAVHALEQVERLRATRGRGRYSLWTGDVGAALFAADCLEGRSGYPVVDAASG